jgi:hypothetical protein
MSFAHEPVSVELAAKAIRSSTAGSPEVVAVQLVSRLERFRGFRDQSDDGLDIYSNDHVTARVGECCRGGRRELERLVGIAWRKGGMILADRDVLASSPSLGLCGSARFGGGRRLRFRNHGPKRPANRTKGRRAADLFARALCFLRNRWRMPLA